MPKVSHTALQAKRNQAPATSNINEAVVDPYDVGRNDRRNAALFLGGVAATVALGGGVYLAHPQETKNNIQDSIASIPSSLAEIGTGLASAAGEMWDQWKGYEDVVSVKPQGMSATEIPTLPILETPANS